MNFLRVKLLALLTFLFTPVINLMNRDIKENREATRRLFENIEQFKKDYFEIQKKESENNFKAISAVIQKLNEIPTKNWYLNLKGRAVEIENNIEWECNYDADLDILRAQLKIGKLQVDGFSMSLKHWNSKDEMLTNYWNLGVLLTRKRKEEFSRLVEYYISHAFLQEINGRIITEHFGTYNRCIAVGFLTAAQKQYEEDTAGTSKEQENKPEIKPQAKIIPLNGQADKEEVKNLNNEGETTNEC